MGSQQKKKKRTKDPKSTTSEIKRTQDLDANRLALQPTFEIGHSPLGVGTISYIDVEDRIHSTQTNAPQPPAQVTGLSVVNQAGSDSQQNLSWTATAGASSYNVYRSTVSGFTPDLSNLVGEPITNSYQSTLLFPGTTYYYKVSAESFVGEGTPSAQASATTTGTPPSTPNLWLKFDGNYADSGLGGNTIINNNSSGFVGAGVFGSNSVLLNRSASDHIRVTAGTNSNLDFTTGFSYSFWIYTTTTTAGSYQYLFMKTLGDNNNGLYAYLQDGTTLTVLLKEAGVGQFNQKTTTDNAWHHIVVTYNAVSNTLKLYIDKVAATFTGTTSFGLGIEVDLFIGIDGLSPSLNSLNGRVDEFMYFKGTVLTQAQIDSLFSTNHT